MSRLIIVIEVSSTKYKRRQNRERDKGFNYFREREREIIIIKVVSYRDTQTDRQSDVFSERKDLKFVLALNIQIDS